MDQGLGTFAIYSRQYFQSDDETGRARERDGPRQMRTVRSSPPDTMSPLGSTEILYTNEVWPDRVYTQSPSMVQIRISLRIMGLGLDVYESA